MSTRSPTISPPEVVASERVLRLARELETGDGGALERFWTEVAAVGTPLIDDGSVLTFVWRDRHGTRPGTREVVLIANRLTDPRAREQSVLERLPGTDLWHRSYRVPADLRLTYQFAPVDGIGEPTTMPAGAARRWDGVEAELVADPLCPRSLPERYGSVPGSVVELPDAPVAHWAVPDPSVAPGRVSEHLVGSAALGRERRVWVHEPAQAPSDLFVLLDGEDWLRRLDGATILDNLVAAGAIPPTVTVFVDSIDRPSRVADLSASPQFLSFLCDELVPWARAELPVSASAVIGGQSLGGLTALLATNRPQSPFGAAIAQSPSLWWAPAGESDSCWLARRWTRTDARVWLEVGRLEARLRGAARELEATIRGAGAAVSRREFGGGHEALCWRAGLGEALVYTTGSGTVAERGPVTATGGRSMTLQQQPTLAAQSGPATGGGR